MYRSFTIKKFRCFRELTIEPLARVNLIAGMIENGLHYSTMVEVWKAIAEAARRAETQIFATTHSWECIKAAHEAFTADDTYVEKT